MKNPEGIDTGDIVYHESTGEEWVVACVENGYLCPHCGGRVKVKEE